MSGAKNDLKIAMENPQRDNDSLYGSIIYNIPSKTLERRFKENDDKKGSIRPSSTSVLTTKEYSVST